MQRVRYQTPASAAANPWFEQRKDFHLRSLYSRFFESYTAFVNFYGMAITSHHIDFTSISELVGTESAKGRLWLLKDQCHRLFKGSRQQNSGLVDWVIGSIFHEAMKLKENIYMYQSYGPEGADNDQTAPLHCGLSHRHFMAGIARESQRQTENLAFLFNRAKFLLRTLLPSQAQNDLLIRLLIEEKELSRQLWSESVPHLFADLYPDQPEAGYLLAARSYFKGQWLSEALAAFQMALDLNPDLEEARRRTFLIRTMITDRQKIIAD